MIKIASKGKEQTIQVIYQRELKATNRYIALNCGLTKKEYEDYRRFVDLDYT